MRAAGDARIRREARRNRSERGKPVRVIVAVDNPLAACPVICSYPNLTVKKIPNAVLSRCEWGKDDYSLKVEKLPKTPPPEGQQELF
jgi:hypothetical protein